MLYVFFMFWVAEIQDHMANYKQCQQSIESLKSIFLLIQLFYDYLKLHNMFKSQEPMSNEPKYRDYSSQQIRQINQMATITHVEELEIYKYLRRSQKKKSGLWGQQFDLRFDELRESFVNMCGLKSAFTFWTNKRQFIKNNPKIKNYPGEQDKQELQRQLKIYKPVWQVQPQNCIRYTWIGHSTAVIQIGNDNLLIDPVFAERCSFSQFLGPRRFRPAACKIEQLPKIDLVLISHDHYDHLEEPALIQLQKLFDPVFMAGLGSQDVLPKGWKTITMDWMDQVKLGINNRIYKITFVPVCHWSRRWMADYNSRLWGGFVIQTPFGHKIFYSGDTGYCGVFQEIGHKYGPFDLTILPIGAYQPNQLLKAQHINPQQAVKVHKELRSRQSVGVHWGTFPLGAEGYFQAKYDLIDARTKHKLKDSQFLAISHGQSVVFPTQIPK